MRTVLKNVFERTVLKQETALEKSGSQKERFSRRERLNIVPKYFGKCKTDGEERMAYSTVGKKKLVDFFVQNPDRQFTADEIYEKISGDSENDRKPGKSSVYRQLSGLCDDRLVRRFHTDGSKYLYQYMGSHDCAHHFHLRCMSCGEIIHLECEMSEELLRHIRDDHGFSVDSGRSILFGFCKTCRKAETV